MNPLIDPLHIEVFAELEPALAESLLAEGVARSLHAGEFVQRRGEVASKVILVRSGALQVAMSNPEGKQHIVRPLLAGQLFNLLPVLDGGTAIHDAFGAPDAELLLFDGAQVRQWMVAHPSFATAIYRLLHMRTRELYEELAATSLSGLRQRCARVIVYMFSRQPEVDVVLSQAELADMLGYSRPIVNRELNALKQAGIIELGYQRIVVRDLARLRKIAQSS